MTLSQMSRAAVDEQADPTPLAALWQRIEQHLEDEKERLFQEIRSYPPPIPACDAQFNGLLEGRAAILQALGQVKAIRKESHSSRDQIELLDKLLSSSTPLSDELMERIRRTMAQLAP